MVDELAQSGRHHEQAAGDEPLGGNQLVVAAVLIQGTHHYLQVLEFPGFGAAVVPQSGDGRLYLLLLLHRGQQIVIISNIATMAQTKMQQEILGSLIRQLVEYGRGDIDKVSYELVPEMLKLAKLAFQEQPALLEVLAPVKVVGSIYGHFQGLIKLFDFTGWPGETAYLFLGNYVDKGPHSLETILLLLAYKAKFPNSFFLLRGCHECSYANHIYGFYQQCRSKQALQIWKLICEVFNEMPYAACIDGKIFCVSGGVSPYLERLIQIENIEKGVETPKEGLACDLVWSDLNKLESGFQKHPQGISFTYGRDVVERFLIRNSLELMVRSKEVLEYGYEFDLDKEVLSLFSAANFLGKFDNNAGVLAVSHELICELQILKPKIQPGTLSGLIKN